MSKELYKDKDWLYQKYEIQCLTIHEIAIICEPEKDYPDESLQKKIRKKLIEFGIKTRDRREQAIMQHIKAGSLVGKDLIKTRIKKRLEKVNKDIKKIEAELEKL